MVGRNWRLEALGLSGPRVGLEARGAKGLEAGWGERGNDAKPDGGKAKP
jgi:hypothetical protein